ncbi:MAG: dihydroorotate dehydrogenase [Candidatus Diapherotrites archaeon]
MAELKVDYAGVKFRNPTVLVSGVFGTDAASLKRAAKAGAGAVTMKSIGPEERQGHNNPTVVATEHFMHNAVGLPTPGYKNMGDKWEALKSRDFPLIASVFATSVEEHAIVAEEVASHKPDLIELNLSCPNVKGLGHAFGTDPETAAKIVEEVKKVSGKIPVIAKLTPNTHRLVEVGKACEEAGANGLVAINTLGGMMINIDARRPILHNKFGGVSGPAIKPVAVKSIYQLYANCKIPILGMGGIMNGEDAIELMMAGASAVGIGTAVHYRGIEVFELVVKEMNDWMDKNGVKKVSDLVGVAHE